MHVAYSNRLDLFVALEESPTRVRLLGDGTVQGGHPLLGRVLRHIESGRDDFSDVELKLDVSEHDLRVLTEMRKVPPGETITYGELAKRANSVARAVGGACSRNPCIIVVPCHRVVNSDGSLGHYSGAGGVATKAKLLAIERGQRSLL